MSKKASTIKHVIFDVDGVIISGCQNASKAAIKKFGLKADLIELFFHTKWQNCVEGRVCIESLLSQELPSWGFKGEVKEYLDFWFTTESQIDSKVLQLAARMREKGIKCHLGSNQERLRAKYLWENCRLNEHFDSCFFSGHMGVSKPNSSFYAKIQELLKANKHELILIDDAAENVQGAKKAGWEGILWPSENHLLKYFELAGV